MITLEPLRIGEPYDHHSKPSAQAWQVKRNGHVIASFPRKRDAMEYMEKNAEELNNPSPYDWHTLKCYTCGINVDLLQQAVTGSVVCRECFKDFDEQHEEEE